MAASGAGSPARLVQYVVVRSDLVHALSWPLGAVITQACHAATAALHVFRSDPDTARYLEELDSMHKVVLGVRPALLHSADGSLQETLSPQLHAMCLSPEDRFQTRPPSQLCQRP
ncbi:putative peptidyl-tRNA hydrolase PTRHD1 isoform X2 [Hippoglossus hippoglossus]|uniref:putative peptidyl-tRNA hydrolase PTRHD1 isoform X2 n=1 Tax=Hippoglossus hippoglossus TaxID=8267 RepID=UPI00148DADD4|nr:putative peptidyl-tRNA hydrolase PTRHD1 isoform X2 [Hippoglossus hippoglossus]